MVTVIKYDLNTVAALIPSRVAQKENKETKEPKEFERIFGKMPRYLYESLQAVHSES